MIVLKSQECTKWAVTKVMLPLELWHKSVDKWGRDKEMALPPFLYSRRSLGVRGVSWCFAEVVKLLWGKFATADKRIVIWKSKDYNEREHLLRKPTIAFDIRLGSGRHPCGTNPILKSTLCMCLYVCDMFQHTILTNFQNLGKLLDSPPQKSTWCVSGKEL